MKILRLRKEELGLFDWLDPVGMLAGLELPNRFALAAAALPEDWSDVPAGLFVAGLEEERMVIEWLCVDPERRNKGNGKYPETLPVSALGEGRLGTLIREFRGKENACGFYGLIKYPMSCDLRCSRMLMDGNEVCGLFLVTIAGNALYPVFFYAESERDGRSSVPPSGNMPAPPVKTAGLR